MPVEPRNVEPEDEDIMGSVVVVCKVSEFEELRIAVLDSPLVLEVENVTGELGGMIGVTGNSMLVEVDADVDKVVALDNDVVSDVALPDDDGMVIEAFEV